MVSVICVDDDPDIQALYQNILGKREFELRVFNCGIEAINSFSENPADVIILDMNMPGLDGLETCHEIRKLPKGARIPILIVSSKDSEDVIMSALASGINDYILKPFKPSELLAKINFSVKRRKAGIKSGICLSFSENYEIVNRIDEGAQTTVYYAKDISFYPERDVALKIFKSSNTEMSEEKFKTSFLREAYGWSKLDHANIVKLYDFGQFSGSYFLVLEYIKGITLWDQVNTQGAQEDQYLVYIAHELVAALVHISKYDLVHRDIKPNNILLSYQGDVKLTDFGLAKHKKESKMTIMNSMFKGTPDFVSPEQIEGKASVDNSSDIYSLGVTLYFAATAEYPFRGDTIIETLNNHFKRNPRPIHEINPKVGKELSSLINRMMAREKKDRIKLNELQKYLDKLMFENVQQE